MSNDNDDAAMLAAVTGRGLRDLFGASNRNELGNMAPTRLADWRTMVQRPQPGQQYPQQPGYPPQMGYPAPQGPQGTQSYTYGHNLPEVMQTHQPNLLQQPIGRDAQGNIIYGNPDEGLAPIPGAPQPYQPALQTSGFQLPNFGANAQGFPTAPVAGEESKIDSVYKELKSLKKAINKLIRIVESGKVSITTNPEPEIENTAE